MEETQIGSDNGSADKIEILNIEEVNIDDISNNKDACWKHSAPGPSHQVNDSLH